ncbi:hypothetical protein D791_02634 [Nitrincola nitratireducens]|uniref:Uncharacterized protein n=1 Tax=Nitrincola nitratireducens TaxID=1229521 RepID=W9V039_9GAMM|nr:hypothetical protein D791_02634 [Nitrincola nitratireducens]
MGQKVNPTGIRLGIVKDIHQYGMRTSQAMPINC